MNKRRKLLIIIIIVVIVLTFIIMFGIAKYRELKNLEEIENAIDGVVISEDVPFYAKPLLENVKQIRTLKRAQNVYILEEFEQDGIEWFKIKVDGKINGYVQAKYIGYYKAINSEKVLVSDVSQFNIGEDFNTQEEYETFLVENNISYVYIRAGGRGYGEEGNFYEDKYYQLYVDACEYLKVPYGFYFLDEALNSQEIDEEVSFIQEFLNKNAGPNCKLPIALDIEKHSEKGRTDDIWNSRAQLVQELIDKLESKKIKSIVYSNAKTANLYLSTLNTKFWIAYYPEKKEIPKYSYFELDEEGSKNHNLQRKTIGWQFTENGAGDEIKDFVDISLFNKDFMD